LPECLESVFRQTHQDDLEIIVVNDGSTDNTCEVASAYSNRIRYVEQSNQGLSAARNAGLRIATGEFVNFLDADDVLLPTMISESLRRFESSPDAGVVHSGYILGSAGLEDLSWTVSPAIDGFAFEAFAHWIPLACQTMLLRTSALSEAGEFDVSLRACEDWDMWLRMARSGVHWASVPKPLSVVRMRPISMSRDAFLSFRAGEEVIRRAHREDARVKSPHPRFARGCQCSGMDALSSWLLNCVSFAIAQGNVDAACALLEQQGAMLKAELRAGDMVQIFDGLWYGTAIPHGRWDLMWPKIRRPVFDFLLRQEERSGQPGFACEALAKLFRESGMKADGALDAYSGRALVRALWRRLCLRLKGS
jgi:GT2 family glycosyltransferase